MSKVVVTERQKLEFLAGTIAASLLDKLYVSFENRVVDLSAENVPTAIRTAAAQKDFTLILAKSASITKYQALPNLGGEKSVKVFAEERWMQTLVDPVGTHILAATRAELKDEGKGKKFLLAGIELFLFRANTEGELHDLAAAKLGLKPGDRIAFRYVDDLIPPAPNAKDPFVLGKQFFKSGVIRLMMVGKKEGWKYLDLVDQESKESSFKNAAELSSFVVKDVAQHKELEESEWHAVLRSIVSPAEKPAAVAKKTAPPPAEVKSASARAPRTTPAVPPPEAKAASDRPSRAQQVPVEEEAPFRTEPAKQPAPARPGRLDIEKQKTIWTKDLVDSLFRIAREYYEKSAANRAKMTRDLGVAAGGQPAKENGKTVFNIETRRLLKSEGEQQNSSIVIGYVKGEPLFPGKIVSLAINAKSTLVTWFKESDGYEGINTKLTANNRDLKAWLTETVMPEFWKKFAAYMRPSFLGSQEEHLDVEEVEEPNRVEKAAEGFEGAEEGEEEPSVQAFDKTFDATQEIGFTPAWAASLPILAGEEEVLVNGNMNDLRAQSLAVAQSVLRMDAADAGRLEIIKRNVADLFKIDTQSTIAAIRENLSADIAPVEQSKKPFPLNAGKEQKENAGPEARGESSDYVGEIEESEGEGED